MIIFSLLLSAYIVICFMLILLVLLQKGKGSMGLGAMGGGTQMLFGGTGGQDIFQKATWILGALFMAGSLVLSMMITSEYGGSRYLQNYAPQEQTQNMPISE